MGIVRFARVVRFIFLGLGVIFGGFGAYLFITTYPNTNLFEWLKYGFDDLLALGFGEGTRTFVIVLLFMVSGVFWLFLSILNFIIYGANARKLKRYDEEQDEEEERQAKESAEARKKASDEAYRKRQQVKASYPDILKNESLTDQQKAAKVFGDQLEEAGQWAAGCSKYRGHYIAGSNVQTYVKLVSVSTRLKNYKTLDGGVIVDLGYHYNGCSFRYDANETSKSKKSTSITSECNSVAKELNEYIKKHFDTVGFQDFGYDVSYTVSVKPIDAGIY